MKKKTFLIIGLILFLAAGLSAQERLAEPNNPNANPKRGQAEIIINASGSGRSVVVWLNDNIAAHLKPRGVEKIIVENGKNVIEVAETSIVDDQWVIGERKRIEVNSRSNGIILRTVFKNRELDRMIIQETTVIGRGMPVAMGVCFSCSR